MILLRLPLLAASLLAALLAAQSPAAAQFPGPAPSQGFGPAPSPGFAPQVQQEPPCFKDFKSLRDDIEKKATAIRAASGRRPSPQEGCKMLGSLSAAEEKLIKFTEANATWCGIPPAVLTQIKESHSHTADLRGKVCQAAARPQVAPGPTLSDALGTNRVPDASNVKSGRGTFDTLTGTPLGNK